MRNILPMALRAGLRRNRKLQRNPAACAQLRTSRVSSRIPEVTKWPESGFAILLLSMMLGACATTPGSRQMEHFFNDHLFPASEERIISDDVFAFSDEMKNFLDVEIAGEIGAQGSLRGLVNALRNKSRLKLEYDSAITRNASQTFGARSGNCLSLVIMTAAFAKELGLAVLYQSHGWLPPNRRNAES